MLYGVVRVIWCSVVVWCIMTNVFLFVSNRTCLTIVFVTIVTAATRYHNIITPAIVFGNLSLFVQLQ